MYFGKLGKIGCQKEDIKISNCGTTCCSSAHRLGVLLLQCYRYKDTNCHSELIAVFINTSVHMFVMLNKASK